MCSEADLWDLPRDHSALKAVFELRSVSGTLCGSSRNLPVALNGPYLKQRNRGVSLHVMVGQADVQVVQGLHPRLLPWFPCMSRVHLGNLRHTGNLVRGRPGACLGPSVVRFSTLSRRMAPQSCLWMGGPIAA